MKYKKIKDNSLGFAHHFIMVIVVVAAVASVGALVLHETHADTVNSVIDQPAISLIHTGNIGYESTNIVNVGNYTYILSDWTINNHVTALVQFNTQDKLDPVQVSSDSIGSGPTYMAYSKSSGIIYTVVSSGGISNLSAYQLDNGSAPTLLAEGTLPVGAEAIAADNHGNIYVAFSGATNINEYNLIYNPSGKSNYTVNLRSSISTGIYTENPEGLQVVGNYLVQVNGPARGVLDPHVSVAFYNINTSSLKQLIVTKADGVNVTSVGNDGTYLYISVNANGTTLASFDKYEVTTKPLGIKLLSKVPLGSEANASTGGWYVYRTNIVNKVAYLSVWDDRDVSQTAWVNNWEILIYYVNLQTPTFAASTPLGAVSYVTGDSYGNVYAVTGDGYAPTLFNMYRLNTHPPTSN